MAKPPSRPSTTKVPPRGKGGAGQPSARPVPPRPPRKPNDRRRGGRSQRRFYGLLVGAVIAVAALIIIVVVTTGGGSSSVTTASKQPAVNYTTASGVKVYGGLGPENVPLQVGTPLAVANTGLTGAPIDGVQCNTTEQLTYHHHAHLVIFVNGKTRPMPLGVGMVPPAIVEQTANGDWATGSQTCLYWLHVHAQDGIVHIESPSPKNFLLGQFFGVWHQRPVVHRDRALQRSRHGDGQRKAVGRRSQRDTAHRARPGRAQPGWPGRHPAADRLGRHPALIHRVVASSGGDHTAVDRGQQTDRRCTWVPATWRRSGSTCTRWSGIGW